MKSLMMFATAGIALALTGCDEPYREEAEMAPPPMEAPMAPAAPEQGPALDPVPPSTDLPPTPLSPEDQTSEQTVRPESETLFY